MECEIRVSEVGMRISEFEIGNFGERKSEVGVQKLKIFLLLTLFESIQRSEAA